MNLKILFVLGLVLTSFLLMFGCTSSPSVAIAEGSTTIFITDVNGFSSLVKLSDMNDVDVTGVAVGDVLSWDGNLWVPIDINFNPAAFLDTNWQTSWSVFDANMKTYYLTKIDGNALYVFKGDVNLWTNQLLVPYLTKVDANGFFTLKTDTNIWITQKLVPYLLALDANGFFALKGDVNTWTNQLLVPYLLKVDANGFFPLKTDVNTWSNQLIFAAQADQNHWVLSKLDANGFYALKTDVNVWTNQLLVPYLTKVDANGFYTLKADTNTWATQLIYLAQTDSNKWSLTKLDANALYTLKTDSNIWTQQLLTPYLKALDANEFYAFKTDVNLWGDQRYLSIDTVIPISTSKVSGYYLTDYNSITGAFGKAQIYFTDLNIIPITCPAGTYVYGLLTGGVYCSTPLDTNWQTSFGIFDANMRATYALKGDVNIWIDQKIAALPGMTDTNWETSWNVFDANMRYYFTLNTDTNVWIDQKIAPYLLQTDANGFFTLKSDTNVWINQLLVPYLTKSDANGFYALKNDVNTWIDQKTVSFLTKTDANGFYPLKTDVNTWTNQLLVPYLLKADANGFYPLKGDVNVWIGNLAVPYTGAYKDVNIAQFAFFANNVLIKDLKGNDANLAAVVINLRDMEQDTILGKTRSSLSAAGGVLTYRLASIGANTMQLDFNAIVYTIGQTADVNLTCRTDAYPISNYIYFYLNVGVPTLAASTTYPSITHIDLGTFVIGSCSGSNYTIYAYNRNRYEIDSFVNRVSERFEEMGSLYVSGLPPNASASDVNIGTGEFFNNLVEFASSNTVKLSTTAYLIRADGNFINFNSLSDINQYADGSTIGNNDYVNIVWGIVPTTTTNAGSDPTTVKLVAVLQSKPQVVYNTLAEARTDNYDAMNTFPPNDDIKKTFVPVMRTIQKGGVNQQVVTGIYYQDLRGRVSSGGGTSTPVDLSGYLTQVDANALYQLKGNYALAPDVNTWANQLILAAQTDSNKWSLSKVDANGFYPIKSDVNTWTNQLLVPYLSKVDANGFYALKVDVNTWIGQLDTNWQTSWSAFDANMKGTFRAYTIDLNTSGNVAGIKGIFDKNILIGPDGYIYNDGTAIIFGRT